jgi:hypothetical protein
VEEDGVGDGLKTEREWGSEEADCSSKVKVFYDSTMKTIPGRDSIKKRIEEVIYSSNIRGGQSRIVGEKVFFGRSYIIENK